MSGLVSSFGRWCTESVVLPGSVERAFVDTAHGAAYLDIYTPFTISRITLWDEGWCDVETLRIESGEQIL